MRIYLESYVFLLYVSDSKKGKLARKIFNKADEGKLTIVTSEWSTNQYADQLMYLASQGVIKPEAPRDIVLVLAAIREDLARKEKLATVDTYRKIINQCVPI